MPNYVTLLPKSITTAIGMGVSEEAGGIVTLTVVSIIITGILVILLPTGCLNIKDRRAYGKGLALGTAAHAIGTARALELGEIEGSHEQPGHCGVGTPNRACGTSCVRAYLEKGGIPG